jgi:hypothetical protein
MWAAAIWSPVSKSKMIASTRFCTGKNADPGSGLRFSAVSPAVRSGFPLARSRVPFAPGPDIWETPWDQ